MAKILILRLQVPIGDDINNSTCFYDSLNKELVDNGNEVLCLNTAQELFVNGFRLKQWIDSWINKIKNFNPDIIFTFNNRIFEEIIKATNCPIVLFEADLVNMFAKTDLIKKYKERYYMATFCEQYINDYKKLGFDNDKIILLHPATSVKSENTEKINNISFIGSCFSRIDITIKNKIISSNNDSAFYKMYKEFWNSGNYNYKMLLDKYIPENDFSVWDCYKIFDSRMIVLQSILDLGLKLYGVGWQNLPSTNMPLICSFDSTPVYSLKHNQDIYNSSIVNLSISHPQCKGYSFPWRIYDIMASNGVLVTSHTEQLKKITENYVDIPMYSNPYDARDICKKMLKDENFRNDIIAASNEFIDKFGRWQDNLEEIQSYTNINITDIKNSEGICDCIKYNLYKEKSINPFLSRFKSITYGILYSFCHLPLIYSLTRKNHLNKIYNSMLKYNKELKEFKNDLRQI